MRCLALTCFALCVLAACSDDASGTGGGANNTSVTGMSTASSEVTSATGSSVSTGGSPTTGTMSTGATTTGGGTCMGKVGPAGDMDYTMDWDGDTREYRVHAPPGYDGTQAVPVVLVLHGYTETNDQIEEISQMTPETDARGVIVVYPQGRSTSWNAGSCCGTSSSSGVDDVGFVGAMLDAIEEAYCVDEKRIYSSGFSNGGMLSHRLACEMSDRIAAIGPVSGTIAIDPCTPSRPVPVMQFHGTSDFVVPYNGGGLSNAASVADTESAWITRNGCGTTPMVTFDMGDATCETFSGCQNDATVTTCTLEGGGHQWPGGMSAGPGGTINMDIFASEALLDFFAEHPLP
jgi:polyhydroxybutyrate depolymerase